ncbi:lactate permease LctP family transporter [Deltaproteobacteria bacterium OttesenSCG-928-K17]|nr:lactate permease LctP family transporter [Deltaproteobacteria bacterium OttesenSCG-928-K17]
MQQWLQVYDPLGGIALSSLAAAVPLFLLFYLLAIKRMAGYKAAGLCCLTALVLAVVLWKMPLPMALSSVGLGLGFGLFPIVWVIITAVWIYNMTVESREFDKIKHSLASLTDDRRLQAILIAFAFSAFLEGAAGFGTPVAIAAAMLVGLGFKPFYAAGICLVANSAPAAFGAIGIPVIVSADVAGLDVGPVSQLVGLHLSMLSVFLPLWICVIMCGFKKALEVWPALIVGGLSFSAVMYLVARFNGPALPDIVAGLGGMVCLVALFKIWKPKNIWRFPDEEAAAPASERPDYTVGQIIRAWAPYVILTVLVFICGHGDYKALVADFELQFQWPALHNLVVKTAPIVTAETPYGAVLKIGFLTAAGTAIFVAGLLSSFLMPGYGPLKALVCLGRTARQLRFSILTICLVLGLAYIMNYSGMSSTLGLAFTHTGVLFPFFAPIIGWVGVFLTGSDTSANALFSSLQRTTAEALGVNPDLMVAVNSSGGVTGKMISPQSISIATAATGQVGREGDLFRFALKHSVIMLLMICLITFVQSYFLG